MRAVLLVFGLLALLPSLSACSVGMAMSGKPTPDLSAVRKDADRADVEMRLGPPVRTQIDSHGRNVAVYAYEVGNEPSAGRAVAHGVMDVLTLGLWEVVGTPIEAIQGDRYEVTVTYGTNDAVLTMSSVKIASGT